MSQVRPTVTPTLTDLFDQAKRDIFTTMNCVKVGKINTFDTAKKTAQIQILFKRVVKDTISSVAVLVDCPVFTLQGGGASLQMPIQAGDECLVLFADRDIDVWFSTGTESAPNTQRCHSLSDGIALVGINNVISTKVGTYSTSNVSLVVPSSGKFVVTGATAAEILGTSALALLSELQSLVTWCKTHVHTDPQGGTTGSPTSQPSNPVGTTKLKGS